MLSFRCMTNLQPRIFVQHAAKKTQSEKEIIDKLRIHVTELREYLTEDEDAYLGELTPDWLWVRGVDAATDGRNKRTWEKMNEGDVALIAWDWNMVAVGEIVMRKFSPAFAKSQNRETHPFHYFLLNVEPVHIPYADVNRVLGYGEGNNFQGFMRLEEDSGAFLDLLKEHIPTSHLFSKDTLIERALEGDMDRRTEVTRRCEQGLLRRLYFENRDECRCGFCGRDFPIEFLVAAHIKRRADCSDKEKRDVSSNIIPACRFGCDELFERGYILGINGVLTKSHVKPATGATDAYISLIEGRQIGGWDRRGGYFDWHATYHS